MARLYWPEFNYPFCRLVAAFNLNPDWNIYLQNLLNSPPTVQLLKTVFAMPKESFLPESHLVFEAFNKCALQNVKIIVLGQDPYHGLGQANGLAFSVADKVKIPPSLVNIFKNMVSDYGFAMPKNGNLEPWASQGVLLLNTVLTVAPNNAGAHSHLGWQNFTDAVIAKLSADRQNLVFLLWGKYAQEKQKWIDGTKHLVLTSVHPSPLSAYKGFIENKHFSLANAYLVEHGKEPVDWQLP